MLHCVALLECRVRPVLGACNLYGLIRNALAAAAAAAAAAACALHRTACGGGIIGALTRKPLRRISSKTAISQNIVPPLICLYSLSSAGTVIDRNRLMFSA